MVIFAVGLTVSVAELLWVMQAPAVVVSCALYRYPFIPAAAFVIVRVLVANPEYVHPSLGVVPAVMSTQAPAPILRCQRMLLAAPPAVMEKVVFEPWHTVALPGFVVVAI